VFVGPTDGTLLFEHATIARRMPNNTKSRRISPYLRLKIFEEALVIPT
jgi:hypothetical protein